MLIESISVKTTANIRVDRPIRRAKVPRAASLSLQIDICYYAKAIYKPFFLIRRMFYDYVKYLWTVDKFNSKKMFCFRG
jgi:hypothetical protein